MSPKYIVTGNTNTMTMRNMWWSCRTDVSEKEPITFGQRPASTRCLERAHSNAKKVTNFNPDAEIQIPIQHKYNFWTTKIQNKKMLGLCQVRCCYTVVPVKGST